MNKYITYLIYIIIAFVVVVGGFLVYSFTKKNNENVPGRMLDIGQVLLTLPAPQLAFYIIILIALISIVVYNIFKPKYGLPYNVFKFCYNKPFDTRTTYLYKNNKTLNYIPGSVLKQSQDGSSSYGFWLYISGVDNGILKKNKDTSWTDKKTIKKILTRGPLNHPKIGFYIKKDINDMKIKFNRNEQIVLENVPLNRWFQIILTLNQQNVTLYLNGKLIKTDLLKESIPITQNDKLYVGDETNSEGHKDHNFPGLLFKAFYSPNELTSNIVWSIYNKQKYQVIKYYKKNLEPKIKKDNKPTCNPKGSIFNTYSKELDSSKKMFVGHSNALFASKNIVDSPSKDLTATKMKDTRKDLSATKKMVSRYSKDLTVL
tara:strand:+ start:691 stop:1809 length:1119 start_codon:yes stop_codon:yes gene_type:complete